MNQFDKAWLGFIPAQYRRGLGAPYRRCRTRCVIPARTIGGVLRWIGRDRVLSSALNPARTGGYCCAREEDRGAPARGEGRIERLVDASRGRTAQAAARPETRRAPVTMPGARFRFFRVPVGLSIPRRCRRPSDQRIRPGLGTVNGGSERRIVTALPRPRLKRDRRVTDHPAGPVPSGVSARFGTSNGTNDESRPEAACVSD